MQTTSESRTDVIFCFHARAGRLCIDVAVRASIDVFSVCVEELIVLNSGPKSEMVRRQ